SFIGRMLSSIAGISRVLDATTVVVGGRGRGGRRRHAAIFTPAGPRRARRTVRDPGAVGARGSARPPT
ncbi:hypothetical protein, partial [Cellulomonas hominis]|uniref:hypothetical protein n=1 Tax=Cellulomonas hominis TaxID=156981 RepID=UPI001FF89243